MNATTDLRVFNQGNRNPLINLYVLPNYLNTKVIRNQTQTVENNLNIKDNPSREDVFSIAVVLECRDGAAVLQGWRSGESTRLQPMWPGFDSQTRRHMWVELVGSLLCTERFSPGTGFPSPQKPTFDLSFVNC